MKLHEKLRRRDYRRINEKLKAEKSVINYIAQLMRALNLAKRSAKIDKEALQEFARKIEGKAVKRLYSEVRAAKLSKKPVDKNYALHLGYAYRILNCDDPVLKKKLDAIALDAKFGVSEPHPIRITTYGRKGYRVSVPSPFKGSPPYIFETGEV